MAGSDSNFPVFRGSMVALVTPMHPDGQLDLEAFRGLIDWHVQQGTDAVCVVGTSGESPTVTVQEQAELIELAVRHADGRVPIIAGTGGNSTAEAIELQRHAYAAGAAAGLTVVPYYNRPTQEGLYQHFRAIAESCELPSILYNVPGRTVADLANETILRLAQVPGIIGVKEASGNIARVGRLIAAAPEGFHVLSGDDATAAALILLGGQGNISVTANVAPGLMHELCMAALNGNVPETQRLNAKLCTLNHVLFLEANPIPVKWALAEMGLIRLGYRLPLTPLSDSLRPIVREALSEAGCLS
ncbi:4-hydroxy-tetrahydrodipicolinate synthase [Castellaniella sp.]|uniref:4-hydroxy-tetrahydrodipicolinate synthase n=1 Tax=Castellaniella sp. TaxID=1955812 RepID=UPI00356AD0FE